MIYSGKCDGAEESTKCLNRIENDSIASSRWQQTFVNCSRTSQPGSDSLCVFVGVSVCSCRFTFTSSRGHKTSCFLQALCAYSHMCDMQLRCGSTMQTVVRFHTDLRSVQHPQECFRLTDLESQFARKSLFMRQTSTVEP